MGGIVISIDRNCGPRGEIDVVSIPASLLRDLFAGLALQGMLASPPIVDRTTVDKEKWCGIAYDWADALMAERAKREAT